MAVTGRLSTVYGITLEEAYHRISSINLFGESSAYAEVEIYVSEEIRRDGRYIPIASDRFSFIVTSEENIFPQAYTALREHLENSKDV